MDHTPQAEDEEESEYDDEEEETKDNLMSANKDNKVGKLTMGQESMVSMDDDNFRHSVKDLQPAAP